MTDAVAFTNAGIHPEIAKVLARDIDAGSSIAAKYVGADFTRHQAVEIQRQITTRVGSKERLVAMGVLPHVADAIASAIKAAKEQAHLAMWV